MKKFKLGVLAMALVSMLGFTSCLDSGDVSNTSTGAGFFRVSNFMGIYTLQSPTGGTLTPLNQSDMNGVNAYSNYTYAIYSIDWDTQDENSDNYDATMLQLSYVRDGGMMSVAPAESDANAPVKDVNFNAFGTTGEEAVGMFFGVDHVFLPIYYYCDKDLDVNDKDEIEEELAKHQFNLYYNADTDFTPTTMTLHLRHYIKDKDEDTDYTLSNVNFQHFDLTSPLNAYEQKHSTNPSRILISFEQNSMDGEYKNTTTRTFDINYQKVVDAYEQWESNNGSDK